MTRKRGYKRGYPVAILVGLEEDQAVLWHVFSQVAKLHLTLKLNGKRTDEKALYNFHESIVAALRPSFQEGIRTVAVAAPMRMAFAKDFLSHVRKHHAYLLQSRSADKVVFVELVGAAGQPSDVAELVKTAEFRRVFGEAMAEEADNVVKTLEKCLSSTGAVVLFSLEEIEGMVYEKRQNSDGFGTKYLLLTDEYLSESKQKTRINRLLQVAKNKRVKTSIVQLQTSAGKRIAQFGGIVFFATC